MSTESNKKLVLQFCEHLSNRKLEEMFDLLSEDAIWSGVGRPESFKYGGQRTKQQSIGFIGAFLTAFKEFRFDVVSSTAEHDRVAIEANSRGIGSGGSIYENEYMLMFRCAGGQISRITEFFDQISVLDYEKAETA
jgi:uncharacterized protein